MLVCHEKDMTIRGLLCEKAIETMWYKIAEEIFLHETQLSDHRVERTGILDRGIPEHPSCGVKSFMEFRG